MNNDISQEVAAVNRMYESGKITAEERDKLIAALTDDEVTKAISIDYDDDTDEEDETAELDEDDEDDEFDLDSDEVAQIKELKELKDKIVKTVKQSLGKAKRAVKEAEKSVNDDCKIVINNEDDDVVYNVDGDEKRVVNKMCETYEEPYNDLGVTVKYISNGTVLKVSDSALKTDNILEQCAEVMDDESLATVRDLFDTHFTGSYKNIKGGKVLKVEIAP